MDKPGPATLGLPDMIHVNYTLWNVDIMQDAVVWPQWIPMSSNSNYTIRILSVFLYPPRFFNYSCNISTSSGIYNSSDCAVDDISLLCNFSIPNFNIESYQKVNLTVFPIMESGDIVKFNRAIEFNIYKLPDIHYISPNVTYTGSRINIYGSGFFHDVPLLIFINDLYLSVNANLEYVNDLV